MKRINRRRFLAGGISSPLISSLFSQTHDTSGVMRGRLYKTLKIGMIKEGGDLREKFSIAKEAGFEGVELNAPGYDIEEARQAISDTGLLVDGTVCADHWNVRHSDPDPVVRKEALRTLLRALEDTQAVGGDTVLLVVGHGKDGTEEEVWSRSVESISQAIPLASRLGVTIAVENVWNEFCYDPKGGSQQNAEKFAAYIDAFNSPWVGMQFDIGNHWKFGNMGNWIRLLGKRIIKLDVKGFSRKEDKWTRIGEGDIDFADVTLALRETGFAGWCAAEVGGGDLAELRQVAAEMDQAFGLT